MTTASSSHLAKASAHNGKRIIDRIVQRSLRALFAAIMLAMALSAAHAAGEPLPMWEIRSTASKGAVYLLGSVHVCRESCLQFPESILRRFRNSQALVLELDPTNAELGSKMMSSMALPSGQSLSGKLSPSQLRKLQSVASALGLPLQALDSMRPVMAETVISMLAAQKLGLTVQDGVDTWFLQQARATGKPLRELETVERQLAALNGGSDRDQIASLDETLDMVESGRMRTYLEDMIQAWQSGNLTRLSQLMKLAMKGSPGLEQTLIAERNAEMADKLALWLGRGEQLFVVIGAGHIAGTDNVAEQLERKGFSVRQLNNGE